VNAGKLGKGSPKFSNNLSLPKSLVFFFMSSNPRISRRRRGLSPETTPIFEIRRRKIILSTQESALRRTFSDSASSPSSPIPITFNMTSTGSGSGTGGASSSQPFASSVIGIIYNHQVPVQSTSRSPPSPCHTFGFFG
jgi:hypothetical protein